MNKKQITRNIKLFEKSVNYYFFDVFKLYDYELTILDQINQNVRASCEWHFREHEQCQISIFYSQQWIEDENLKEDEIKLVALHEVCEALLSELQDICEKRYIKPMDITGATHRVIRRMENLIFPLINKRLKLV